MFSRFLSKFPSFSRNSAAPFLEQIHSLSNLESHHCEQWLIRSISTSPSSFILMAGNVYCAESKTTSHHLQEITPLLSILAQQDLREYPHRTPASPPKVVSGFGPSSVVVDDVVPYVGWWELTSTFRDRVRRRRRLRRSRSHQLSSFHVFSSSWDQLDPPWKHIPLISKTHIKSDESNGALANKDHLFQPNLVET